jgi:uncharacterized protein (UPF0333 family)
MKDFMLILVLGIIAVVLYFVAKGKGSTTVIAAPSAAATNAAGNSAAGIIGATSNAISSLVGAFNTPTTDDGFNGN